MDPLDPGCCGCCLFLPMPKFLQRWMGVAPKTEITDPEQIRAWADAVFTGEPTIIVSLTDLPIGIGALHQVAEERGYKYSRVDAYLGYQGMPSHWQFDLVNPYSG